MADIADPPDDWNISHVPDDVMGSMKYIFSRDDLVEGPEEFARNMCLKQLLDLQRYERPPASTPAFKILERIIKRSKKRKGKMIRMTKKRIQGREQKGFIGINIVRKETQVTSYIVMERILSTKLRMMPVDDELETQINEAGFDGFVKWAIANVRTLDGGNSKFIDVYNCKDTRISMLLRKPGRAEPWAFDDPEAYEYSGPDIVEDEYALYMGTQGSKERALDWGPLLGSMWIRKKGGQLYRIVDTENTEDGPQPDPDVRIERIVNETLGKVHGDWKHLKTVYKGQVQDYEQVVLWGCISPQGLIVDRVISKCLPYSKSVRDDDLVEKNIAAFKREIRRHAVLSANESDPIVRLRGASRRGGKEHRNEEDRYIAFLEYCEGGDLKNLILRYQRSIDIVPEIFLWILFRNLVAACMTVESNTRLVHTDIKAANIFLRERPSPGEPYTPYYQPVLGDFGMMYPMENVGVGGTPGWYTPETAQKIMFPPGKMTGERLHVFSIGLNVWSMMRGKEFGLGSASAQQRFLFTKRSVSATNCLPDPEETESPYSTRLETLVKDCMEYSRNYRPTLKELKEMVDSAIRNWQARFPGIEKRSLEELPDFQKLPMSEEFLLGTEAGKRRPGYNG
ncbi:kinase-like protein [Massarina eburnea CBS 473.64]|uniref:Kinase-like protein n=1 Tax=Massarina eburnea CBS 473.64 TaxID=1395130 RepID=A0A6A6RQF3_9PLEO|nr:kinase-like protein [Massarina eburnea CBS 473.64]